MNNGQILKPVFHVEMMFVIWNKKVRNNLSKYLFKKNLKSQFDSNSHVGMGRGTGGGGVVTKN